jgi:short subunit dehydrogenase-like uncharacterized protein
MTAQVLIYGATGYTGKLIARQAREQGLRPLLAGRDPTRLRLLAETLGCEYQAFPVHETHAALEARRDIVVVLNAAGPFSATAPALADACLRTGTHYLDVSGEIPAFAALAHRDAEARSRNVMLMPGVGFAVVPSDCLAAHVARRLPGASRLKIGLSRFHFMSRGSAKTMLILVNNGGNSGWMRRAGRLLPLPLGQLSHDFDYGNGAQSSIAIGWADVFTAFFTTGIPNIEVYVEANPLERLALTLGGCCVWMLTAPLPQSLLKAQADLLPEGPSDAERSTRKQVIVAEATDASGKRACARLHTPDTYTCTALTAVAVVKKILDGEAQAGFQTPGRVYGPDFVLSCDHIVREDVAA